MLALPRPEPGRHCLRLNARPPPGPRLPWSLRAGSTPTRRRRASIVPVPPPDSRSSRSPLGTRSLAEHLAPRTPAHAAQPLEHFQTDAERSRAGAARARLDLRDGGGPHADARGELPLTPAARPPPPAHLPPDALSH